MCMHPLMVQSRPSLTPSQIADLRLAASTLTGSKRRAFEAEMTWKYLSLSRFMVYGMMCL